MTVSVVRRLLLTGALLAMPLMAYAQEAVLTGTVADSTGGVLPGVTVTAVHEASGNRFVGITDEQPEYQFAIDRQQVNSEQGYGGQPRDSQDSIAEFQFISNRFDATMGRSTGCRWWRSPDRGATCSPAPSEGTFAIASSTRRIPS